ncbi:MAG TPA: fused MFS/spermidine synthase [Polyangia bacterium]|nr:fused MFS/spermidine synthase [Polyangia bacterium]
MSGAAALMFEALWLRGCGLLLGNSVAASSLVLASFMTGLALGNALAARVAARVTRPLLLYAALELAVGTLGTIVVLATPALTPVLAPGFRALAGHDAAINLLRLTSAFVLLLPPTIAMGMTLPVVARALSRHQADFGRVLGRLYGWNTLGGMTGAIAGELWLLAPLGVRGTALCAAGLNGAAALLAWSVGRRSAAVVVDAPPVSAVRLDATAWRLLAAAFLSGGIMLALEVVWFRFLQLSLFGTTLTFAFMLAVILLGLGLGGLAASAWLRRAPDGHRWLPAVAAACAASVVATYAAFSPRIASLYGDETFFVAQPGATLVLSLRLMLVPALASGILFTLQGAALRARLGDAGRTAGSLTMANTLGAMAGALGAGFGLLPALGMERSLLALAVGYAAVAALTSRPVGPRRLSWGALAAIGACVLAFPRGAMVERHLKTTFARYLDQDTHVAAMREGVHQTTTYLRSDWAGQPAAFRLVTNGHSMSGTQFSDRRYMKLFVNWAMAVNPRARRALLINYGLGSTAKALVDTRALQSIDVVDISRDILEMTAIVFQPERDPLADPRVRVHLEDGRFFLQTTGASFDLITGEPPPPKAAGITSLYSREYFGLIHARLNDGGVATYWLPVEELDEDDARAITGAFCAAFADCALWTGAGPHWMLTGTRGLATPPTEQDFAAQWRDPVVGPELLRLGLESPAQLGATFLADAAQLAPWFGAVPPLDDAHPHRLSPRRPAPERQDFIERWMEAAPAAARFEASAFVRALWPARWRDEALAAFATQPLVDAVTFLPARPVGLEDLRGLLLESTLTTLPLLAAGGEPRVLALSQRAWEQGARSPALAEQLGLGALSQRAYGRAAELFGVATASDAPRAYVLRAFASMMAEADDQARVALARVAGRRLSAEDARDVRWLSAMLERTDEP